MSADRPVADQAERDAALDPARSFIVQAPAGSGKTELLIQRFLALLSRVERPEEIEAITFTRKAAAEMRKRVWQALLAARDGERPAQAHHARTWDLARAAVERDRAMNWQLLDNARRLRIETIDALCLSLTRQMPVLARLGARPEPIDDAAPLFAEAARLTLAMVETDDEIANDVAAVLEHLDNDTQTAQGLLSNLLGRRDQWLPLVQGEVDRAALEAVLEAIWVEGCDRVRAALPLGMALVLPQDNDFERWLAVVEQYVIKGGTWRKNAKLPAQITGNGELLEALHALRSLPGPRYEDSQWFALGAILRLARVAAGQLRLVFAAHNQVDFIEIVHGAKVALGTDEEPTDLLIALDYRIRHLLVDEFQDTSAAQFRLFESLTCGWQPGDGRTLFLVGDPMQSIYRFRQAEVALFLRARREGVGAVRLDALTLHANFRSQSGIVDWVNETFARVMPPQEAIAEGAVPYSASVAVHREQPDAVTMHAFLNEDLAGEAQRVVELAKRALDAPGPDPSTKSTCAILVRSRTHLLEILPALRAAGVAYRAVEIDRLDQRTAVRDLLALTRALSHPADRTAWLAVLRAPWCGLPLADLHALAGDDASSTVLELLEDGTRMQRISDDGRARAAVVRDVLAASLAARVRTTLRDAVEGAWLALSGPATLVDGADLEDVQLFLDYLESQEVAGLLPDLQRFEADLQQFHAKPDLGADDRLQVMTIHRAKGLEFDTVILPQMGSTPPVDRSPLLATLERRSEAPLLAAMGAVGGEQDRAHQYIAECERRKSAHESARLLYVATTRPRHSLHLLADAVEDRHKQPVVRRPHSSRSMLAKLWPMVEGDFAALVDAPLPAAGERVPLRDVLKRLPQGVARVEVPEAVAWFPAAEPREAGTTLEFSWASETARHVGTVAHRWLQKIAEERLDQWTPLRVQANHARFAHELAARGVDENECKDAAQRVSDALIRTLEDKRGRWLLGAHEDAASERRLTLFTDQGAQRFVIDRTFVADGRRWIVDYKTSDHQGADLEAFLDEQRERYRPQLDGYARAVGGAPSLALYFPLVGGWREWG
jgi:ATP-dependent helicase/nuclease subunit A